MVERVVTRELPEGGNVTGIGSEVNEAIGDAPIAVPIDVSGGLTKTQVLFGIGQLVAAVGAVVGFLGLGETNWIVRLVRFLQANEAVPVLSIIAWAIVSIGLWWRAKRRQIERVVLGFMVSNKIAVVRGKVHPKIQAAIDEALAARMAGNRREDR